MFLPLGIYLLKRIKAMKKNILVIAAHPDDEVLGCGGTIARYADEGSTVSVMILGEGVTSRDAERQRSKRGVELRKLKEQSVNACKILGVNYTSVHDLPDNRFDTVPLLDVVKLIEKEIAERKPEVIFTHSKSDLNIDHEITHRAVLTATRPVAGQPVKELYAFEVPSSTEWAFGSLGLFNPNIFVDIKDYLELKIKAMAAYGGESREFPHPRSPKALEALAGYRGSAAGFMAAEAFEAIRMIF